jgi:hypothetical protein
MTAPMPKFAVYELTTPYFKDICVQMGTEGCMKFNKVTYNAGGLLIANPDNTVTIDNTKTLYVRGRVDDGSPTEIPLSVLKKLGTNLTFEEMKKITNDIKNNSTNNPNSNNPNSNDSKKTITIVVLVIALLGLLKWKKII